MKIKHLTIALSLIIVGFCKISAQLYDWTVYNNDIVWDIAIDSNGDIWICRGDWNNFNQDIAHFDGTNWTVYNNQNSGLPSNNVTCITIDNNGNKWIGTGGGLARFDGTNWTVYNTQNSGLPSNGVTCITIDNNGNKWIGTGGGLARFDGTNWTVYNTQNSGLPDDYVRCIAIDNNGDKWIGTNWGGLARFDGTNWMVYNTQNSGLPSDDVRSIAIDNNGDKWIGTHGGGLARFDGTNWTVYNTQNSGLPDNYVTSITIDNNGDKWIGIGGGLARFDGTNWTVYNTQNSVIPSNAIYDLQIDNAGVILWVGTYSGLTKMSPCPAPPSNISITPGTLSNACPLSPPTTLTANGTASHWVWSDGYTSSTRPTPTNPGTYVLSVTGYSGTPQYCTASGTVSSNTVTLQVYNLPANDVLCLVTVDTLTGKNQLIWNKTGSMRTDSFRIYKETTQAGMYDFAGNQSYANFSTWSDQASNPAQQSDRYYLSVLDSCGAESRTLNTPVIHRTIHLSSNQGINGENNLNWSPYEGFTFSTYNIWRKNNGNPFVQIGSVPSTNLSFSDLTPPSGTNHYLIEVVLPAPCSPSAKTSAVPSSFSNAVIQAAGVSNTPEQRLQALTLVYPNPAKGVLNIALPEAVAFQNLTFTDLQGRKVSIPYYMEQNEIKADISLLPSGMWIAIIETNRGIVHKTWVKE
jgi:hypothetical protein